MSCQATIIILAVALAAGCCGGELLVTRQTLTGNRGGLGIYDGSNTTIEEHPYLVAILLNGEFYCAGTIITDSWIITLASCAIGNEPSEYKIVAGSSDGVTGKIYKVKKVALHPSYTETKDYDFACMQIKGPFEWSSKVKAVKLPAEAPKDNTKMVVAGWGDTSADPGESNGPLLQGYMKWLPREVCKDYFKDYGFPWTARLACTYNKGKTTLCDGDFGDAFVSKGVVYGMFEATARAVMCTSKALPLIVADIDAVTPWIKKVTGAKYENE